MCNDDDNDADDGDGDDGVTVVMMITILVPIPHLSCSLATRRVYTSTRYAFLLPMARGHANALPTEAVQDISQKPLPFDPEFVVSQIGLV